MHDWLLRFVASQENLDRMAKWVVIGVCVPAIALSLVFVGYLLYWRWR